MTTTQANSTAAGHPRAAPRMRDLDFFVGSWDAAGVFHETPFGPRKDIDMHVHVEPEVRGLWLTTRTAELATPDNPAPLTACYAWGFDATTDEFVADWYDSNGGRAVQRSSGWRDDVLQFNGPMTMNGASVPLRDTFTRTGPDPCHHLGEIDLGAGWLPVDEENAVRQGAGN